MTPVLEVIFDGKLTPDSLESAFATIDDDIPQEPQKFDLIVNCLPMDSYEIAARENFVAWNRAHRHQIRAVGILTTKVLWHMVIRAMGLASGMTMRPLSDHTAAKAFFDVLPAGD